MDEMLIELTDKYCNEHGILFENVTISEDMFNHNYYITIHSFDGGYCRIPLDDHDARYIFKNKKLSPYVIKSITKYFYSGKTDRNVSFLGSDIERMQKLALMYKPVNGFHIKKVIFNDPATIVYWSDGTKTIVKTQGAEPYDKEKGLAMCVAKKCLGSNTSKGNYYDIFKKWGANE